MRLPCFVAAGDLTAGMVLSSGLHGCLSVTGVVWRKASGQGDGSTAVYNFTVADTHTYFVGSLNGGTWVHNGCTVGEIEDAYDSATAPYKNGPLTQAGRALAKHNPVSRPGSAFPTPTGSPANINDLAADTVNKILTNPGSTLVNRGGVYDIVSPTGEGVRYWANGSFKGFLEP